MKIQKKFPVLVLAYSRPDHLSKTIEALIKQGNQKDQDIFFCVDGLPDSPPSDILERHEKVVKIVQEFSSQGRIHRMFLPKNEGVFQAFKNAMAWVFEKHEGVIYLEEDIVPYPGYLDFMNAALHRYQAEPSVYAVNGFAFSELSSLSPDYGYFSYRFCPWGFGTWHDRFKDFDEKSARLGKEKFSPFFWRRFNRLTWGWGWSLFAYTFFPFLRKTIQPWDILWCLKHYQKGHMAYFPKVSWVYNAGLDYSGLHSVAPIQQEQNIANKNRESADNVCFPEWIGVDLEVQSQMSQRMGPIFRTKALRSGKAWLKSRGWFCKKGNIS